MKKYIIMLFLLIVSPLFAEEKVVVVSSRYSEKVLNDYLKNGWVVKSVSGNEEHSWLVIIEKKK